MEDNINIKNYKRGYARALKDIKKTLRRDNRIAITPRVIMSLCDDMEEKMENYRED